jgi:hypothetical protein
MKALAWTLGLGAMLILGADPSVAATAVTKPVPAPACRSKACQDPCATYGYSGASAHAQSCKASGDQRTITCVSGYEVIGSLSPSVTLTGSAPFKGCTQVNTCVSYGYSGHPAHALSCKPGVDVRTITCQTGYMAARDSASVTLTGAAPFAGCLPTTAVRRDPRGR